MMLYELARVSKVYESKPPFEALKSVSFRVKEGEFISIIGPSGSGKSTFLHLLGFLDKPTSGEIFFEGKKTSEMSEAQLARIRQKEIGFVFQAFNLAPTLTVFKNVELPLIIQGMPPAQRRQIVEKHLAVVGLSEKKNSLPSQLSGGEKQRVAIARALVTSPKVILADEPTGNLDSKSGKIVLNFIANLHEERGITVVLVTHDPYVATFAQRTIHIKDGMIEKETARRKEVRK